MKKFTAISLAAFMAATTFVGCNSSGYEEGENTASSVAVYSFSLSEDDSILANLDTVFFSIDLNKALIFNADSLPYGTPVNKLVPVIRTLDNVSKVELTVHRPNATDTVFDYLENPGDTIDFSNGPVLLSITSPNGDLEATYTVKVNVHEVKSDSLVWGETSRTTLPSTLTAPTRQRTVKMGAATYCLTNSGDVWSMATRANVADDWDIYTVTLPQGASANTFNATDDALYVLCGNKLHASADGGRTWHNTGATMDYVYGNYGTALLGAVNESGEWYTTRYPGADRTPLIDGMPIGGTSGMVPFSFELGTSPISVFVGGYDINDLRSNSAWGFDGENWAKISVKPLPKGLQDAVFVPFFAFTVSPVFVADEYSISLAFGGSDANGMNRTVYVSQDCGRTWAVAGDNMQLPPYMPSLAQAQAYLEYITLGSRADDEWTRFAPAYRLPATASLESPFALPLSRATKPIEEWNCPYIYYYGGVNEAGTLSPYVWRATLNRLTFKPIL